MSERTSRILEVIRDVAIGAALVAVAMSVDVEAIANIAYGVVGNVAHGLVTAIVAIIWQFYSRR